MNKMNWINTTSVKVRRNLIFQIQNLQQLRECKNAKNNLSDTFIYPIFIYYMLAIYYIEHLRV